MLLKSLSTKQMFVPSEFKVDGATGQFSGYASIFGNVDLGGDVISKDAPFKEIVKDDEGNVVVLFQHDMGNGWTTSGSGGMPIGKATVEQNSKGLKFDGQLVMEDPFVQRVHAHMKAKTLRGMSIGYDILPGGAKINESGVRELNALKLWEISPVIFGMNPKAGVDTVKGIQRVTNIRDLEDMLREAVGLSRTQAKLHSSAIWNTLSGQRDAGDDEGAVVQRMTDYLATIGR